MRRGGEGRGRTSRPVLLERRNGRLLLLLTSLLVEELLKEGEGVEGGEGDEEEEGEGEREGGAAER